MVTIRKEKAKEKEANKEKVSAKDIFPPLMIQKEKEKEKGKVPGKEKEKEKGKVFEDDD